MSFYGGRNRGIGIASMVLIFVFCEAIEANGQPPTDYAPGSLIVKFTREAVAQPTFRIRIGEGRVVTGLASFDSLTARWNAFELERFYPTIYDPIEAEERGLDRMYVLQFPALLDMEIVAAEFSQDPDVEEAYPNYLSHIHVTPQDYYLGQNFPNPFRDRTTFVFRIPEEASVVLSVHDLLGRLVYRIGEVYIKTPTRMRFEFRNPGFPPGMYFIELRAKRPDGTTVTKPTKMALIPE